MEIGITQHDPYSYLLEVGKQIFEKILIYI